MVIAPTLKRDSPVAARLSPLSPSKQPYKRRPSLTGKGRIAAFRLNVKKGRRDLDSARECGKRAFIWEHKPCGGRWSVSDSCNRRVCSRCSRRRAMRV